LSELQSDSQELEAMPSFLPIFLSTQKDGRLWCGNHVFLLSTQNEQTVVRELPKEDPSASLSIPKRD